MFRCLYYAQVAQRAAIYLAVAAPRNNAAKHKTLDRKGNDFEQGAVAVVVVETYHSAEVVVGHLFFRLFADVVDYFVDVILSVVLVKDVTAEVADGFHIVNSPQVYGDKYADWRIFG